MEFSDDEEESVRKAKKNHKFVEDKDSYQSYQESLKTNKKQKLGNDGEHGITGNKNYKYSNDRSKIYNPNTQNTNISSPTILDNNANNLFSNSFYAPEYRMNNFNLHSNTNTNFNNQNYNMINLMMANNMNLNNLNNLNMQNAFMGQQISQPLFNNFNMAQINPFQHPFNNINMKK
jgi:hypothetical protein